MAMISTKLLKPRPQELGKIKIGGKGESKRSQGGKEFRLPVKFDHFEITTRHRGGDDNFTRDDAIHSKVGDAPTELRGMLMYSTIEENFHAEMTKYSGQKKVWTCDGEEATNLQSGACGPCPRLTDGACACKPYMRLLVQLWDAPVLGYHVFRSTGWETTRNIQTALTEIYTQFGTLYHAPIKLVLYPATVNYEEHGKQKTSSAYMVGLTLAMSIDDVAREMVSSHRLMESTRSELRLLSAGVQEEQSQREIEEERDIAEEYFPETAVDVSIATQSKLDTFKNELRSRIEDAEVVEDVPVAEKEGSDGAHPPNGEKAPAAAGTPDGPVEAMANAARTSRKRAARKTAPDPAPAPAPATTFDESQLPLDQVEEPGAPSKHQINRKYFGMLGELTEWSEGERKMWQEQRIGKASCSDWSIEDYQRAIALLEAGEITYDPPRLSDVDPEMMPV